MVLTLSQRENYNNLELENRTINTRKYKMTDGLQNLLASINPNISRVDYYTKEDLNMPYDIIRIKTRGSRMLYSFPEDFYVDVTGLTPSGAASKCLQAIDEKDANVDFLRGDIKREVENMIEETEEVLDR